MGSSFINLVTKFYRDSMICGMKFLKVGLIATLGLLIPWSMALTNILPFLHSDMPYETLLIWMIGSALIFGAASYLFLRTRP